MTGINMEGVALKLRSVKTRAASIAALACAALLSSSMPVGATLPGDNGFLLSSGAIGSQSGLFAYRADGSGLGILEGTEGAESPAWSPSGRRIAYSKVVGGNEDVYVIQPDGSEIRLTNDLADDFDPAWSPNGAEIVFVSNREGNNELYAVGGDGVVRRLTNNTVADTQPTWSSANQIAFTRAESGGTTEVFTINPDGTGEDQLTVSNLSAFDPNYSPDGTRLIFTRSAGDAAGNDEIFVVNVANGTGLQNLTNTIDREEHAGVFSPDGTKIAFLSGYLATEIDVRTIASFGGAEQLLLDNTSLADIDWQPLCDTCDSRTTVNVKYKGGKLNVKGAVFPAHPGSFVTVTLYKKSGKRFAKVSSKRAQLDNDSRYQTLVNRASGKACRLKVRFPGDDDTYPSVGVLKSFPC